MKIYEIGTGYTSIPANKGAATEIVAENLARSLNKLGHDVSILDISDTARLETDLPIMEVAMPKGFSGTDEALGIKHKLKRVIYSILLAGELKRILKGSSERVVLHFHNQYNAYFFYKLVPKHLRDKAVVAYTVHSYVWHDSWDRIEETIKKRYFQEVDAIRKADAVFVLCSDSLNSISKATGVPEEAIHVIANGVDIETYRPLQAMETARLRNRLGLEGKHAIIQVGSVCDRKNQAGALEMLAPLLQERKDLVYLYAGGIIDEDYKVHIDRRSEELDVRDQVIYLGEINPGKELNGYYNLAECGVFPSKAEAFSLVILESMSSGRPALVSENLRVDLDGAIRYRDGCQLRSLISEKILQVDSWSTLSKQARLLVESKYSWMSVAQRYASAIEDAFTTKGTGGKRC